MRQKSKETVIIFLLFLFFCFGPAAAVSAQKEQEALEQARSYIDSAVFSESNLIEQLTADGFSSKEAIYAAENCGADWNAMAAKAARALLENAAYSETGMVKKLKEDGFTEEQAAYGAEHCGASWDDMAVQQAKKYTENMVFSENELTDQLLHDGFTREQAVYAAEVCGIDWNALALQQAERHLSLADHSEEDLVTLLILDGFSEEQARSAAQNALNGDSGGAEKDADLRAISEEMKAVLQEHLYILFPIQSLKEAFPSLMEPYYFDIGPGTAVQTRNQDGLRKIKLLTNTDPALDRRTTEAVYSGNLQNFLFSMEIHVKDVFPADRGGCFIAYTNEQVKADPNEETETVALLAHEKGVEFYRIGGDAESGTHQLISSDVKESYNLTLVRLTGLTFAFIDGKYAGQFYDDSSGPFRLLYGNAVFSGGDNAYCEFDNLAVRKVNN